jgi:hypothetical protein
MIWWRFGEKRRMGKELKRLCLYDLVAARFLYKFDLKSSSPSKT